MPSDVRCGHVGIAWPLGSDLAGCLFIGLECLEKLQWALAILARFQNGGQRQNDQPRTFAQKPREPEGFGQKPPQLGLSNISKR
jgi:hypothetical protein